MQNWPIDGFRSRVYSIRTPEFASPPRIQDKSRMRVALAYPAAKTIHLVMDNLNIHSQKSLAEVFGAEMASEVWGRFTVHYTPTHGSWLNQAEIEIGIFLAAILGEPRNP
jgi:hypothetical protein